MIRLTTVINYRVIGHVFFDEVSVLPQSRIGDDSDQQAHVRALVRRQAHIRDVSETDIGSDRPQSLGEIMFIVAEYGLGESGGRRFDTDGCI